MTAVPFFALLVLNVIYCILLLWLTFYLHVSVERGETFLIS